MNQRIVISKDFKAELSAAINDCEHDRIFVLTDTNTEKLCLPVLEMVFREFEGSRIQENNCQLSIVNCQLITIGASDVEKTLDSVSHVWQELQRGGATRHSLMINLGGGMVTDLGGFAASTFKRGINFINIPTTLLAMVDASVGGKTGFNFGGLKNEIGVFNDANCVIINTQFLKTLDRENICSGYAEMLKHGLINREGRRMFDELISFDICNPDLDELARMVGESVEVKEKIVTEDPLEHGIRKALNVGHTMGHAFESWAMAHNKPILHGYAVAFGIIPELYLACTKTGFPQDVMRQMVYYIKEVYGNLPITCDDYPELLELMTHDKKNVAGVINFTLLGGVGDIHINQTATKEEILEALDFFREG